MDECNPDRADCGQRQRRLPTDNGLPTNANEGKRVGKKHGGLGKSTKEEKKYVRGRTSALG
jgi:hypothetical protein